jgi:hypothetical protein
VATQPEALRLFDLAGPDAIQPSQSETERHGAGRDGPTLSGGETGPEATRSATTPASVNDPHVGTLPHPSRTTTPRVRPRSGAHDPKDGGQRLSDDFLREAAGAARLVGLATDTLTEAITAARNAGSSWRQLGIATGIPFQTLHRRAKLAAAHPEPPGQEEL